MAGAKSLLTNRVISVVGEAIKVAIAAFGALWIEPWTAATFPSFPTPVHYLISALAAASVLEILIQIVFGWPSIRIEWTDPKANASISEVRPKFRPSSSESQSFHLDISAASGAWLGHKVLRWFVKDGAKLNIQIERASIVPTCERSSKDGTGPGSAPTVTAADLLNGFSVNLGRAPLREGAWHFADVRWRDEGTPVGTEFRINYLFHHDKASARLLLKLIRRSANTHCFRVVGN